MPHFRPLPQPQPGTRSPPADLSLERVRNLIAEVMRPPHFFQGRSLTLHWTPVAQEEIPWEIYKGRLLPPAQTRLRQTFESWHVFQMDANGPSAEPLLSIKFDATAKVIHVVRAIQSYAWEGYHAGDNVYLSREVLKWLPELVGSFPLEQFADLEVLRDELVGRLFQAVIGTSRLPLTSVEAPLPAFSLGQLAYCYRAELPPEAPPVPMTSYRELLSRGLSDALSWLERVKLLEIVLRSTPPQDLGAATDLFLARWQALGWPAQDIPALLRTLFQEVALTPYTAFVDQTFLLVQALVERGSLTLEEYADFFSYFLRHLGRHLTAYDLVTFHHQGANYPDALLLDAALKIDLDLVERHPTLFAASPDDDDARSQRKRLRRRALRQGWILRRFYEGHLVPDAPTSPGENARWLPPPYIRVPEEQIGNPVRRTRRLFEDDPMTPYLHEQGRAILAAGFQDLHHPLELRELGMAIFVDRPLGIYKEPGEPDQTMLFSYEAFSRSLAEKRLDFLVEEGRRLGIQEDWDGRRDALRNLSVPGLALDAVAGPPRQVPVSLTDARKVAEDFVCLRSTARTVAEFRNRFDWSGISDLLDLDFLETGQSVLIVGETGTEMGSQGILAVYDGRWRKRLELLIQPQPGYASRGGVEYPSGGLRLLRWWEADPANSQLREHVPVAGMVIPPAR